MRDAVLAALPATASGITPAELKQRVLPHLSQDLFPGGEKTSWWMKAVQLDQEAKGTVARATSPLVRLRRA